MRKMKLLLLGSLLFSFSAQASSLIVEIGGVRHECRPVSSGGDSASCATTAYNGPFSRDESIDLCSGSLSTAPATCAIKAYNGPYSRAESIDLCRGSVTEAGPVDCANLAYNGPFSRAESIELCRNNGRVENATCALSAYNGPFSREEAIKMCKSGRGHLGLSAQSSALKLKGALLDDLIKSANLKAFERGEYK